MKTVVTITREITGEGGINLIMSVDGKDDQNFYSGDNETAYKSGVYSLFGNMVASVLSSWHKDTQGKEE